MDISEFEKADLQYLSQLQPEGWDNLKPSFEYYLKAEHCYPYRLVENNTLVGVGAIIRHGEVSWLGHIVVHPGYQRRGIGRAITQFLIDNSWNRGCTTVELVATDLGAIVYGKMGFRTITEYVFYKDVKQNGQTYTAGFIVPLKSEWINEFVALDIELSGENRLNSLQSHFSDGVVYRMNSKIVGFYLPTLGEGLIMAKDGKVGRDLMTYRLRTNDTAVFMVDNTDALEQMKSLGAQIYRKAKRMRIGADISVLKHCLYNRKGGNIG